MQLGLGCITEGPSLEHFTPNFKLKKAWALQSSFWKRLVVALPAFRSKVVAHLAAESRTEQAEPRCPVTVREVSSMTKQVIPGDTASKPSRRISELPTTV